MKFLMTLLLLLASNALMAESGAYQVEVIVFRNLVATPEFKAVEKLRSFSRYPDITDTGLADMPTAEPGAVQSDLLDAQLAEVLRSDLPDDVHIVAQKSEAMDHAWRRLRSSQDYQPMFYAAWQQNQVDYYPPMRIHDSQIIDTELRVPTMIMFADLTAEDPLQAYRSQFYQVDGNLQLRRSRFLHLYLDLEFRQQVLPGGYPQNTLNTVEITAETDSSSQGGIKYGVYTLKQNRQISTSEMQYFDTPGYGVLVYVTSTP
jgi:hypothetical protein